MNFDKELVAGKLRRWEKYLEDFRLPSWSEIPNIGLYMEQVIILLREYLDYLPPEIKDEQIITAATINNYVRTKIMPEPVKKKYYRTHIAYLIMICPLKQCMSISTLQTMIPMGLSDAELERTSTAFAARHRASALFFIEQVREVAAGILDHSEQSEISTADTVDLITTSAVVSGFSRLLAEKLLLLNGKSAEDIRRQESASE
jgi:hypothetical protein